MVKMSCRDGRAAGLIDGRELGQQKGFEIGSEVGFYAGFCEVRHVCLSVDLFTKCSRSLSV